MHPARTITLFSVLMITGCSSGTTPRPVALTTPSPALTSSAIPTTPANQSTPSEAVAVKPGIDACALLTSEEVKSVQGETLKETKLAGQSAGGLSISQCFFTLPTFSNSISLLVAEKGEGPEAKDPEEFWRDRFHKDKDEDDKDHERVREPDKKKVEEEEEEGAPPQKISGVGEEAYWVGNRVGGALYVLKGKAYLRISVGGPPDQVSARRKSRILAQKALARL